MQTHHKEKNWIWNIWFQVEGFIAKQNKMPIPITSSLCFKKNGNDIMIGAYRHGNH